MRQVPRPIDQEVVVDFSYFQQYPHYPSTTNTIIVRTLLLLKIENYESMHLTCF